MKHLKIYEQLGNKHNVCQMRYEIPHPIPSIPSNQWRRYHYRIEIRLDLEIEHPDILQDFFGIDYDAMALECLRRGEFLVHRPKPDHPDMHVANVFSQINIMSSASTYLNLESVGDDLMQDSLDEISRGIYHAFPYEKKESSIKEIGKIAKWDLSWN